MNRLAALSILLCCNLSFAMGGKAPPANDHSGREQCAFYDNGSTEEHAPHLSLEECRAHHNGNCQERCFIYHYNCQVEGIRLEVVKEGEKLINKEIKETYQASHKNIGRALEIAQRQCETDYPSNRICRQKGCHEDYSRTR